MNWNEPPIMESGAPLPEILERENSLLCAYICSNPDFVGWDSGAPPDHPGFEEYCAVIEFEDVQSYKFGTPSDEELFEHPLYKLGIDYYGFYKLNVSPELVLIAGCSLWVATFHDETLQVIAKGARVVSARVGVSSPKEALVHASTKA
ncbi:hypothetical protein [uncultured Pseudoteredinibacter sp.]|uniref:hypothetical protein n=1 Tax=uncultured Pseudoteredinibacter sp. TaxID=1641701 RepID=UPI00261B7422|nr:hypothetical protein [uncultured Pseudoteredinibacter sp.]